jgi:hypothetical protein
VTYFDEEVEAGIEARLVRLLAADAGGWRVGGVVVVGLLLLSLLLLL